MIYCAHVIQRSYIRQNIRNDSTWTQTKEFLEYLVKSLVDNPDDVKIERKVDEMGVLLTLKVNATNMEQVIGRNGIPQSHSHVASCGDETYARVNLN